MCARSRVLPSSLWARPLAPRPGPQRKEDDCIPEKLVMFLCLSVCMNTLVLGLRQVFVAKTLTAWIALPCLWAVYNAVPPVLFFSFAMGSTKFLQVGGGAIPSAGVAAV
jgi:hypothetical protein